MAKTTRKPARKFTAAAVATSNRKAKAKPKAKTQSKGRARPKSTPTAKPAPKRTLRRLKTRSKSRAPSSGASRTDGSLYHYQQLFHHAIDWVSLQTLDGKILDVNPAGARMLGYKRQELIGRSIAEFVPPDIAGSLADIESALLRDKSCILEARNIRKDGTIIPVEVGLSLVESPDEPLVVVHVRDITERKRMEEALRESEEKYRLLAEGSVHGTAIAQGFPPRAVFVNQAVADLVGVTKGEFLSLSGEKLVAFVHPDDRESYLERFKQRLSGQELSPPTVFRVLRPDGSVRWIEIRSKPMSYLGQPSLQATLIDVTAREEAERALRESEEKYRALVEQSLQGVVVAQGDPPHVVYANPALAGILGTTPERVRSLSLEELVALTHPDDRYVFAQYQERLAGKPAPDRYELRVRRPDGTLRWLEGRSQRIVYRGEAAIQGTFLDITDRKKAEEELRRSEGRFRAIVQDQTELICRFVPDTTLTFVNEVYARAFDKRPEDLVGSSFLPLIPEMDREQVRRELASLDREHPVSIHEHRVLIPDGEIRWQQWTNRALFDAEGNLIEYQSVGRDVTARKLAEEALRKSEETARAFMNATRDLAVMLDTGGRVITLNETMASTLGKSVEGLTGAVIYDLLPPDIAAGRKETADRVIRSGQGAEHEDTSRGRTYASRLYPLLGSDGKVERLAIFATDVTDQRRAELLLREAEKSQAIGILAGGIAQNFRDGLMSITASTTLLRRQLSDAEPHAASLDRIEEGCTRISQLVDELFAIGRRLFPDPRRIQPNECVMQALASLSGRIPKGERFEAVLDPDLHMIQADPKQATRVFFNIMENAVEAVARGGDIRVRTERVSRIPSSADGRLRVSRGPFVHIQVEDTGCGMTPEDLARVFDPFFTTKETGRGMGMAVARAVVEHYGGLIFLDSEKGRGTRVHLYMPAEPVNGSAESGESVR